MSSYHMGRDYDGIRKRLGLAGNGLSYSERLERAERILRVRMDHARWAGKRLAYWAITEQRQLRPNWDVTSLVLLLTQNDRAFSYERFRAYQVAPSLWPLAQQQLENDLRAQGWL